MYMNWPVKQLESVIVIDMVLYIPVPYMIILIRKCDTKKMKNLTRYRTKQWATK